MKTSKMLVRAYDLFVLNTREGSLHYMKSYDLNPHIPLGSLHPGVHRHRLSFDTM